MAAKAKSAQPEPTNFDARYENRKGGGDRMKEMSFRQWLKENHAKAKDNRLGDLWDDAKDDINFPWKSTYRKQLEYLMRRTHEYAVYDTLNSAWHSYIDYLLALATGEED